jgi:outer membrane lipoprotein carrier protein
MLTPALRVLSFFMVFFCVVTVARSEQRPPAVKALEHFYKHVHTLRTDFHQVESGDQGETLQDASGTFYLKRPSRFNWQYDKPYQQSIVSNGQTLWIYDKGLQQVTVRPVSKALRSTPALLLSGGSKLRQAFKIEDEGKQDSLLWVRLVPRDENSDFQWVRLGFKDSRLSQMVLKDNLGELSHIHFTHMAVNIALDSDRFTFSPPPGTDVVKGVPR